ncbi:MAG: putative dsRNA-binding protein, partial [Polyangiales bacterium]
ANLGGTPSYRIISSEGPDHEREFTVAIELNDEQIATGVGRSRVEAEQAAAELALDGWQGGLEG